MTKSKNTNLKKRVKNLGKKLPRIETKTKFEYNSSKTLNKRKINLVLNLKVKSEIKQLEES